jgi:hypothetical protein
MTVFNPFSYKFHVCNSKYSASAHIGDGFVISLKEAKSPRCRHVCFITFAGLLYGKKLQMVLA